MTTTEKAIQIKEKISLQFLQKRLDIGYNTLMGRLEGGSRWRVLEAQEIERIYQELIPTLDKFTTNDKQP